MHEVKHRVHFAILYGILCLLAAFLSYQVYWNNSPQEVFYYWKRDIQNHFSEPKVIDLFPKGNLGIIQDLAVAESAPELERSVSDTNFRKQLIEVLGIHFDPENPPQIILSKTSENIEQDGLAITKRAFLSYDGVEIPFYQIVPSGFVETARHPAIIMYSGHGSVGQLVFEKNSYQHAGALELARNGFIVFAMENRGMGELSHLGDHLRIDAVARLTDGSWYGEITTDALYLFHFAYQQHFVEKGKIGVGGVSTGGALSLFVSALEKRVSAAYVQGYLGSFATTFGTRANHHICNNLAGIFKVGDLHHIAARVAPRPQLFVNGTRDTFFWQDAENAFQHIRNKYAELDVADRVEFMKPSGVAHELSPQLAVEFFMKTLKQDQ